jgi:uncharacterized protein with FMN-binding domain
MVASSPAWFSSAARPKETPTRSSSTACDKYDYGDGAYTAKAANGEVSFQAQTESPKYGKLVWQGVVRGKRLDATFTMVRDGKTLGEKWVLAGEK